MSENNIRYFIETELIRKWFFEEGDKFIPKILEDDDTFGKLVRKVYDRSDTEFPYKEEDYSVEKINIDDDHAGVLLHLPEAKNECDCLYIIILFDMRLEDKAYFTVEKGFSMFEGQTITYLGEWTADGEHKNYGQCSDQPDEIIPQCIEIFLGKPQRTVAPPKEETPTSEEAEKPQKKRKDKKRKFGLRKKK